jgi:hypothetical protein
MNDGSALVIFLLLQRVVEGEQVTFGRVRRSVGRVGWVGWVGCFGLFVCGI